MQQPDINGHFGPFGGRYVGETLMPAIIELEAAYREAAADKNFIATYQDTLTHYVGRPTPLDYAQRLSIYAGGAQIWLKREDLAHSGAHKINNTVGQGLLAKRMERNTSSPKPVPVNMVSLQLP